MKTLRTFIIGALLGALTLATPYAQDPSSIIRLTPDGWLVGAGNSVPLLLGANGKGYIKISETGAITYINSASSTFLAADGTASAPSYSFASEPTFGWYRPFAGGLAIPYTSTQAGILFSTDAAGRGFELASVYPLTWSATATATGSPDLFAWREAANHLFQRNSTNAQRASWANTYTSSTNYEAFSVDWQTTPNTAIVGTRTAATGTGRTLMVGAQRNNATDSYTAALFRPLDIGFPSVAVGLYDKSGNIITNGSTAATPVVALGQWISSATSGSTQTVAILPTYNQSSGTAANTDLLIQRTETAIGSGAQYAIQTQRGSTNQFTVTAGSSGKGLQIGTAQAAVPTCSASCGTSPSVVGSDTAMIVTMGSSGVPASPFTVTFNGTWAAAPSCTVMSALNTMVVGKMAIAAPTTTTTVIVTTNGTAPGTSDKYFIHCIGVQ